MSITKKVKNYKWLFCTLGFIFVVLCLLGIITWNPVVGLWTMALLVSALFVGSVLKKYFERPSQTDNNRDFVSPLTRKQYEGSQKLLRYATAILSFLSLITTANGMKSFVFSLEWMAYIGSFAVQSILVVFSLLLCRFFVQVSVLSWPSYIKTLAKSGLVVFFCVALIVSSIFSFTYIANNAYKDTRESDSETVIYNFLLKETQLLQKENNRRGKKILNNIDKMAKEKLEEPVTVAQGSKEKAQSEELRQMIQSLDVQKKQKGRILLIKMNG